MRQAKFFLIAVAGLLALVSPAHAALNVVATLPDFGALATEIGGDKVEVTVLAKATEDPHFVDARPSFVVKLRNADVLIEGGAELEMGWLPPLLQNARNEKIEVGAARPRRRLARASSDERPDRRDARRRRRACPRQPALHDRPHHRQNRGGAHRPCVRGLRCRQCRRLRSEREGLRGDHRRETAGMGQDPPALQGRERRRVSRLVAVFGTSLRSHHRYLPRTKAGHPAVATRIWPK